MREAKPVLVLLVFSACGVFFLLLTWLGAPLAVRMQRLTQIQAVEGARKPPPTTWQGQADWLLGHRLKRLEGLGIVIAISMFLGLGEGLDRRRYARFKGVGIRAWTVGVVGLALAPGLCGVLVLLPQPWSYDWVAPLGCVWGFGTVLLLSRGYPDVA